ncbi:MAG: MarP family serine protease [Thermoleophilia bacterium]|nr:MarP family serine protease [Thermoleophilia bacterium]
MVDLLLLLLLAGTGLLGWRRGLAVSLVAAGAFAVGGLPVAALAAAIGAPPPAIGYLIGGMLALIPVALQHRRIEEAVDELFSDERAAIANRVGGAVVAVMVAVCLGWFVAALAEIVPSESATMRALRGSATLGTLVDAVPPQGSLGALVLRSGLAPSVNGPLVLAEVPDPAAAAAPGVLAARSRVLQVRSTACDSIVTGTGWVAGAGIVVTNAHVVAGSKQSFLAGGPSYQGAKAVVTAFDPINDVAVLTLSPGTTQVLPAPLPVVARVRHGESAAVIGYPLGGEQKIVPARVDRVASFDVEPLGGGAPQVAPIFALRADVLPGNSGGPVVALDGSVLGLIVAKGLGQRIDAAYGVASRDLLPIIAEGSRRIPVSTGGCLEESDLITEKGEALPPG